MREGHRTNIRQQITDIFHVAAHLRDDLDDRVLFTRQPEWKRFTGKKPSVEKPDAMLQHVIRFAFGFKKGANSRVTRYASALHAPFQAGVSPEEIAEHVRANGGISKMYEATVRNRAPSTPRPAVVTIRLETSDMAKGILALQPGQEAQLRVVVTGVVGQSASARIVKLKPRKPKTTV